MHSLKLTIQPREVIGKKVKRYRAEGLVPAVLYGGKNKKALPLLLSEKEFRTVYKEAGASSLVSLEVGKNDVRNVLVHDVQRHAVSENFLHVDLYEVRMDIKLKTKVPLVFIGESAAVKNEGGMLVRARQELEIECLPKDLPHEISVDISVLAKFHDSIRIKDLKLPTGVSALGDVEDVLALVEEPRTEAEIAGLSGAVEDEAAAVAQVKVVGEEEKAKKEAEKAAEGASADKAPKAEKK